MAQSDKVKDRKELFVGARRFSIDCLNLLAVTNSNYYKHLLCSIIMLRFELFFWLAYNGIISFLLLSAIIKTILGLQGSSVN